MGAAGAATGVAVVGIALVMEVLFEIPFGLPDPPILAVAAVVFYVIMANVCYTGGWVAELVVRRAWPGEAESFATLTFTLGLVFGVVVTLLPALVIGAAAVVYGVVRAAA